MHVAPSHLLMIGPKPPTALTPSWRAGDLLVGKVIGAARDNSSSAAGNALLRIGNTIVTANSQLPLRAGQLLQLSVTTLSPRPVLKVMANTGDATPPALNRVLAQTLPRLPEPTAVLRLLRALPALTAPPTRAATQPAGAVPVAATRVLDSIPSATALLRAPALARALNDVARPPAAVLTQTSPVPAATSGAHYPSALIALASAVTRQSSNTAPLAAAGEPRAIEQPRAQMNLALNVPAKVPELSRPTVDRASRSPLNKTAAVTRNNPGVEPVGPRLPGREPAIDTGLLRDLVEGAVTRMRGQQLLALHHNPTNPVPLAADLPVQWQERIDLWHFEFEHPDESGAATVDGVRIRLLLQFDEATSVTASISLSGGQLQVTLDSNSPELRQRLDARLADLESRLSAQGLAAAHLAVGPRPDTARAGNREPLLRELA